MNLFELAYIEIEGTTEWSFTVHYNKDAIT